MSRPEVVLDDLVIKQVASLAATGASINQIAEQLGATKYHVRKIMATDRFKGCIKDIGDEALNNAKQIIRTHTGDLAQEVNRVLREQLAENSLEAVKVALKIIGFDQEERTTGDTNINVVLPGQSAPTNIDAEFTKVEDSDVE